MATPNYLLSSSSSIPTCFQSSALWAPQGSESMNSTYHYSQLIFPPLHTRPLYATIPLPVVDDSHIIVDSDQDSLSFNGIASTSRRSFTTSLAAPPLPQHSPFLSSLTFPSSPLPSHLPWSVSPSPGPQPALHIHPISESVHLHPVLESLLFPPPRTPPYTLESLTAEVQKRFYEPATYPSLQFFSLILLPTERELPVRSSSIGNGSSVMITLGDVLIVLYELQCNSAENTEWERFRRGMSSRPLGTRGQGFWTWCIGGRPAAGYLMVHAEDGEMHHDNRGHWF